LGVSVIEAGVPWELLRKSPIATMAANWGTLRPFDALAGMVRKSMSSPPEWCLSGRIGNPR
jgi:hypothetical protein